jgi:hypothetical protein
MTPTPRLRLSKPPLRKLTSTARINHASYPTSRPNMSAVLDYFHEEARELI